MWPCAARACSPDSQPGHPSRQAVLARQHHQRLAWLSLLSVRALGCARHPQSGTTSGRASGPAFPGSARVRNAADEDARRHDTTRRDATRPVWQVSAATDSSCNHVTEYCVLSENLFSSAFLNFSRRRLGEDLVIGVLYGFPDLPSCRLEFIPFREARITDALGRDVH